MLNNSRVEHCRYLFEEDRTELFILGKYSPYIVHAMVRPGRKFKRGTKVQLTDWLEVSVLDIDDEGIRTLQFSIPHDDPRLKAFEHIPLPPYIMQDDDLATEYQTVYAKPLGSLAAPTAGLHFTPELLAQIKQQWPVAEVTLHVGLGTFAKLTEDNLRVGRLHEEIYEIDEETAQLLNKSKHITAVGTTSVRTLETERNYTAKFEKTVHGTTEIFIRPGFKFKAVDSMITNFHLPSTSLLMLVAAFLADKRGMGEQAAAAELRRIYQHAIGEKYRFYSFGDAMILV